MGLFAKLFGKKKKNVEDVKQGESSKKENVVEAPSKVAPTPQEKSAQKTAASEVPAKEKTEAKPVAPKAVKKEKAEKAPEQKETEPAASTAESHINGKYEFHLEEDGYHFFLIANNGQVLFDSPSFTTLSGAVSGIATFQKAAAEEEFFIKKDKFNRYRFILANKYYGENYDSKDRCQKSAESVKNFAPNSKIVEFVPTPEALTAFKEANRRKRSVEDVDWKAVEEKEAAATKMGKFEICREEDAFCFYLFANNGEILYSSHYFNTEAACRKGIDSFKRAVYIGNFFVDPDKFGTYRFVLKNIASAPSFIGESYESRAQCERVIESVKSFVVTAKITTATEEAENR